MLVSDFRVGFKTLHDLSLPKGNDYFYGIKYYFNLRVLPTAPRLSFALSIRMKLFLKYGLISYRVFSCCAQKLFWKAPNVQLRALF